MLFTFYSNSFWYYLATDSARWEKTTNQTFASRKRCFWVRQSCKYLEEMIIWRGYISDQNCNYWWWSEDIFLGFFLNENVPLTSSTKSLDSNFLSQFHHTFFLVMICVSFWFQILVNWSLLVEVRDNSEDKFEPNFSYFSEPQEITLDISQNKFQIVIICSVAFLLYMYFWGYKSVTWKFM